MESRRRLYYVFGLAAAGVLMAVAGRIAYPVIASLFSAAVANLVAARASRRWIGASRTLVIFASLWLIGFAFFWIFGGTLFGALILPPLFLASIAVGSAVVSNRATEFIVCVGVLFASLAATEGLTVPMNVLLSAASGSIGCFLISSFKPIIKTPVQFVEGALFVFAFVIANGSSASTASLAAALVLLFAVLHVRRYVAFDDIIVFVDENKTPVATSRKLEAHHSATRLHLAFSVFLFNSAGELLLQRRAETKKTWPGVWSNSCCGHQMLYESIATAAKRRIRHELGLSGVELYLVMPDFRYRAEKDGIVENEICPVFVGFTDKPPRPNPLEVGDIRWIDWHSFVSEVDSAVLGISPWALEEVRLLDSNQKFRDLFDRNTKLPTPITRPLTQPGTM